MNRSLILTLAGLTLTGAACFNTDQRADPDAFASDALMKLVEAQNGFGRLLPYVVAVPDPVTGLPSSQLIEIRTLDDLFNNPSSDTNPILAPSTWPLTPINPAGRTGNHFVSLKFTRSIDRISILDPAAAGLSNNGLTGTVSVVAYDEISGESTAIAGRGFVDGYTYAGVGPKLERWVSAGADGGVDALTVVRGGNEITPGIGFPGTDDPDSGIIDGGFVGSSALVYPTVFVFVVDSDQNLSTYEAFPENKIIRVVIAGAELDCTSDETVAAGVRATSGRVLEEGGIATSTVGADDSFPVPLLDGPGGLPVTCPADLDVDLPCDVQIHFAYSEACQPHSMGPLPATVPPPPSNEFTVEFLPPVSPNSPPPGSTIQLPYTVQPVGPFNFTEFIVRPIIAFPGSDPFGAQAVATVTYFHNAAVDLFQNSNDTSLDSTPINFTVGSDCPGLVNVPVQPGAILVGSNGGGTTGGLRVIDLDGFGQGTGDPTHDSANSLYNVSFDEDGNPVGGDVAKFPFNPNLGVPDIFPPLSSDTTSLAGGSRGVFTLAQDSTLRTQLLTSEQIGTVLDMQLGHPLDRVFNNFDCLSGGRNLCANAAFQLHPLNLFPTAGNSISHSPHPNPPRLRLAPSCFSPLIQTEEPTFGDANRDGAVATNLLVPGDPFGDIGGLGPSGLLTQSLVYAGFWGPAPAAQSCPTFTLRQQIGHFLYILDSSTDRILVVNSNRMTILDVIPIADPRDLAISPDMNTLAVSNKSTDSVSFIDTNPNSLTFHTVIKTIALVDETNNRKGSGPSEIVWQPEGEDILVVCERSQSLAIIAGGSLEVRKIIPGVTRPRLLAVTNRDILIGFNTQLYYAYVISQDGQISIFESGPDGIQGIGFDDIIGKPALEGRNGLSGASAVCMNPSSQGRLSVFIAYRDGGRGAVGELWLDNAPANPRPVNLPAGVLPDPNFRSKEWKLLHDYRDVFSSTSIVDLAVDDLNNIGGQAYALSIYVGSTPVLHSCKSFHRPIPGGQTAVSYPRFLFAANANGLVDVLELSTGRPFVNPIQVPGASVLCHWWRQ
jgi:hypothetical protein